MNSIVAVVAALFSSANPTPRIAHSAAHLANPLTHQTAFHHAAVARRGYAQTLQQVPISPKLEREHQRLIAYLRQQIRNK